MAKGSRFYLEVNLFHALPALYSDGFMQYTFSIVHTMLYSVQYSIFHK